MGFAGPAEVALEHIGSYLGLIRQVVAEYRAALLRRIMYGIFAFVTAAATLLAAWVIGLAVTWDTPWRVGYCVTSALVFAVATAALATLAMRDAPPGPHTKTLKDEAAQDLALLQEWRRAQ
jgi:uncharacterized membrane protein YqjE